MSKRVTTHPIYARIADTSYNDWNIGGGGHHAFASDTDNAFASDALPAKFAKIVFRHFWRSSFHVHNMKIAFFQVLRERRGNDKSGQLRWTIKVDKSGQIKVDTGQ